MLNTDLNFVADNKKLRQSPEEVAALFCPKTIAVVGASSNPTRFGGKIIPTLLRHKFPGKIYPINAMRDEIGGLKCYPDVAAVSDTIDCVLYALGAEHLQAMLPAFVEKSVRLLVVSSAGFAERGDVEGRALQQNLIDFARSHGIRVLGPNCIGFSNFAAQTCVSSAAALEWRDPPTGHIGIVSQSGGLGLATVLYCALEEGIGFSNIVTTGNEGDLDAIDIARAFVKDPATDVVGMTIEAVRDAYDFVDLLKLAGAAGKPVVILKSGRTDLGKTMAASHTGALAGSAAVFEAICTQYGAICTYDVDEFYQLSAMFAKLRRAGKLRSIGSNPAANCTALSISGGHIGLFADQASLAGLKFPDFTEETKTKISQELGFTGNFQNPLDTTAKTIGDDGFWGRIVKVLLDDQKISIVMPIITVANSYEKAIRDFIHLSGQSEKVIIVTWAGGDFTGEARELLSKSNVPMFTTAARAATAARALSQYCSVWNRKPDPAAEKDLEDEKRLSSARTLLMQYVVQGKRSLTERESKTILAALGFPVTRERQASTVAEAMAFAREIGYPVVVKGEHPDILHKSEVGIVFLGVADDDAMIQAFDTIADRMARAVPNTPAGTILVQEMISTGTELIVGTTTDLEFGPVVLFGFGGIFVEIMSNVAMRVAPFNRAEAMRMLESLRGIKILQGARGRKSVDLPWLASLLVRLGCFAAGNRNLVKEVDINPLIVGPGGGRQIYAVDGLFVLHDHLQSGEE